MNKNYKLKKKEIFQQTFNSGANNNYKGLFYVKIKKDKKNKFAKIGIAVPKKTGNAPYRNYIKRQVRDIFSNLDLNVIEKNNYVFIFNKKFCNLNYYEKRNALINYYNLLVNGKFKKEEKR